MLQLQWAHNSVGDSSNSKIKRSNSNNYHLKPIIRAVLSRDFTYSLPSLNVGSKCLHYIFKYNVIC